MHVMSTISRKLLYEICGFEMDIGFSLQAIVGNLARLLFLDPQRSSGDCARRGSIVRSWIRSATAFVFFDPLQDVGGCVRLARQENTQWLQRPDMIRLEVSRPPVLLLVPRGPTFHWRLAESMISESRCPSLV